MSPTDLVKATFNGKLWKSFTGTMSPMYAFLLSFNLPVASFVYFQLKEYVINL